MRTSETADLQHPGIPTGLLSDFGGQCNIWGHYCFVSYPHNPSQHRCSVDSCATKIQHRESSVCTEMAHPLSPISSHSSDPRLTLSWCLLVVPLSCKSAFAQHCGGEGQPNGTGQMGIWASSAVLNQGYLGFFSFWVTDRKSFVEIMLVVSFNQSEIGTLCSNHPTVFCLVFSLFHMVCFVRLVVKPKWKRLRLYAVQGGNTLVVLPATGKLNLRERCLFKTRYRLS